MKMINNSTNKKITKIKMRIVILWFFITVMNVSCQKFVDIKRSSSDRNIETAQDCQLLLNNYDAMNIGYPTDGEVSADDYYLSDAGYLLNVLSASDRDLYVWSKNASRPGSSPNWDAYRPIYYANLVLDNLDKVKGSIDQTTVNDLRGQALFFRSYGFWEEAQLYTKPYIEATASQDLGIPLRLSSDINDKSDRGTVQQVYTQIIKDLQESVSLLAQTSSIASRPNKAAAYGMLARVYLSMGNYEQALNNSNLALQINNQLMDYNTISVTSATPFTRFNKEVVFHSVMAAANTLNPGGANNNVAKIDLTLVSSYSSNDLRRQIYLKANSDIDAGTFRFSGNYEPSASANLFNGIAVDELYLIRAECYARAGNITSSMADLNTLLKTRWVTGTYIDIVAINVDDALTKVLTERRKELLMRGQRWTDLRRLNQDTRFAKTLSRTIAGIVYTLPPNDIRYTLLIPDGVISLSGLQQNPR